MIELRILRCQVMAPIPTGQIAIGGGLNANPMVNSDKLQQRVHQPFVDGDNSRIEWTEWTDVPVIIL